MNIESPAPHAGPGLAIRGASGLHGMLGSEERRIRLWERAEGELGYLRRFRNPVLEGLGRVVGKGKVRRKKADDTERDKERGRTKDERESRPASQKGERRSVRFDTGAGEAAGGEEGVEGILKRLWDGDGAVCVGPEQ